MHCGRWRIALHCGTSSNALWEVEKCIVGGGAVHFIVGGGAVHCIVGGGAVQYHSTDAAAANSGLKLSVKLLHCAGGVKSLSQQDNAVQEEERSDAINHVL